MPPSRGQPAARADRKAIESNENSGDVNISEENLGKLRDLLEKHDDHTRLLFHLEKFVSLVYFDPEEAKKDDSASFEHWKESYDLWQAASDAEPSRAARKNVQKLQEVYEKSLTVIEEPPKKNAPKHNKSTVVAKPVKQERSSQPVRSSRRDNTALTHETPSNTRRSARTATSAPPPTAASVKRESKANNKRVKQETKPSKKAKVAKKEYLSPEEESDFSDTFADEEEYWNISDWSDPEDVPSVKSLKLTYSVPGPTVAHPSHLSRQEYGGDLDTLLSSYKLIEDESIGEDQWQRYIEEQAAVVRRVEAARESGLLDELERLGTGQDSKVPKFIDPVKNSSHWDNFVSQAVYLAKIKNNNRKIMQSNAKKNAQSVELYFRRLAGAEEKERKDQERLLKQLAKKIASDVLKKWKLAEKVVNQRRELVLQEENKVKGRQYLNQILEKSAQLLESRINDPNEISDFSDLDEPSERQQPTPSPSSSASESEIESDRFSDSDDDEVDEQPNEEEEDDENLTVEQLRAKYQNIPDLAVEHTPESPIEFEKPSDEILRLYEQEDADSESEQSLSDSDDEESDDESLDEAPTKSSLGMLFGAMNADEDDDNSEVSDPDLSAEEFDSDEKITESVSEMEIEKDSSGQRSAEPESSVVPTRGLHKIETPFLLRGVLREYQRDGLDWLAGLYNSQSNGILADEMGLGKTIQTISLLSYLACEKQVWGPHLIVVPTSVMLNWEMEFKRFAPGFKVLTYYGNPQQRKEKRRGWNKDDTWHVCITSYQLVIQDQVAFKRKRWRYMILDEAHNIKNFRSQRWQALLNFNSERRLLLTGTPLQNNLVELWSLLYFLMPSSKGTQMMPDGFANLEDFQEWFARPVDQMVEEGEQADDEAKATISKLHTVLRPYLLRRLKADVEKQMPGKYEHVVYTKLSKRQRYLYDDFMSRAATKETLASGNFMSILNCLMQLRKVCNHPDLFEVRPIVTSLAVEHSVSYKHRHIAKLFDTSPGNTDRVNLDSMNLVFPSIENDYKWKSLTVKQTRANRELAFELAGLAPETVPIIESHDSLEAWAKFTVYRKRMEAAARRQHMIYLNMFRTNRVPIYGKDFRELVTIPISGRPDQPVRGFDWNHLAAMDGLVKTLDVREKSMKEAVTRYSFVTPPVVCLDAAQAHAGVLENATDFEVQRADPAFHESQVRLSIAFPDKHLLQYDCGKLQRLAILLRDLIQNGHRVLIFTQMTKVLDILEQFLNIHGWRYMRLDGATGIEQRQVLTERFNNDASTPVFILSTRSGGLGINLTGADTVIFYDSDWNPAMDKQCQDRCHRIGQTRDVHIYRLVSEFTIESNILRKATQKTILDNVVIQDGDFTTDYFNRITVQDLLGDNLGRSTDPGKLQAIGDNLEALAQAEDADDAAAANVAMSEERLDAEEFSGEKAGDKMSSQEPTQSRETTAAPSERASTAPGEDDDSDDEDSNIGHLDDYMIRFIERGDFSTA